MDLAEVVKLASRVRDDLGRLRARSELAVMFVDLAGSTAYKAQHPQEEVWLPRLARFLLGATRIIQGSGRVVKYIGDELMATFQGSDATMSAEHAAERILAFCDQMVGEDLQVRIGIDFGEVSLLDFSTADRADGEPGGMKLPADPTGLVVDRCARIVGHARPGAVLCSREFRAASRSPNRWRPIGSFNAKGVPGRVEVFLFDTQGAPDMRIEEDGMDIDDCRAELRKVRSQLAELKKLRGGR